MRSNNADLHDAGLHRGSKADALVWLLAAVALLSRIPWLSSLPVNWDAVQLALGTINFDLALHQPHPPGYILFVGLGAALNHLTADGGKSLVLISWLSSALAVFPIVALGRLTIGGKSAVVAGFLWAISPVSWYYGSVGLTYSIEALFAAAVVWQARRAQLGSSNALIWAAGLLGVAGGFRPSTTFLLLPCCVAVGLLRPRLERLVGLAVFVASVLAWGVPLVLLSGGPAEYLRTSSSLGLPIAGSTSMFAGIVPVAANVEQVALTALLGLHISAAFLVPVVARRVPQLLSRDVRTLLRWWLGPPLATFVLLHFGQPGYFLVVLPALLLIVARAIEWLADGVASERGVHGNSVLAGILAAVGFSGVGVFLFGTGPIGAIGLQDHQRFWLGVSDVLASRPTGSTVLLTGPRSDERFRLAGYLFPGYDIRSLGRDNAGQLGVLFRNRGGSGQPAYLEGGSASMFELPKGTRQIVVLDRSVADLFDPSVGLKKVQVTSQQAVWILDSKAALPALELHDRPISLAATQEH